MDQESLPLFDTYYIECEDTPVLGSDYIYFTDINNNLLRFDEANSIYENVREEANASPISALRIHLNITPAKSGEAYLYSNEFISLGELEKDVPIEIETPYPNPISEFRNAYNYVILNKDTLNDFYDAASKNQLENIRIGNNTITGTTNYSEDGYTLLSLAYDRNWHAYLDDKEVEIQDYFNSFMLIETPAGQHTLELKYIPYGMKASKLITYLCWFCTFIGYTAFYIRSRKK